MSNTPKEQVELELQELSTRLDALFSFLCSNPDEKVSPVQGDLIYQQIGIMGQYERILRQRLQNW